MRTLNSWKNLAEVGRLAMLAEICRALLRFNYQWRSFTDWRQRYLDEYMKHIFFSILITLAFLRCQSPEAPKNYLFECYARFDEQYKKTSAEASLKVGATNAQSVEPPGGIRYQRVAMSLVPHQGVSYQYAFNSDYIKEHSFECKTPDGKEVAFNLQMSPLDSGSFTPKVISRKSTATYSWKGAPLDRGEALVFIWENTAKGLTVPMELYQIGKSRSIEFPAVKMAEIAAGDWTYYVVRKKLQKATVNGVAVSGVAEYYTSPQTIKVVD